MITKLGTNRLRYLANRQRRQCRFELGRGQFTTAKPAQIAALHRRQGIGGIFTRDIRKTGAGHDLFAQFYSFYQRGCFVVTGRNQYMADLPVIRTRKVHLVGIKVFQRVSFRDFDRCQDFVVIQQDVFDLGRLFGGKRGLIFVVVGFDRIGFEFYPGAPGSCRQQRISHSACFTIELDVAAELVGCEKRAALDAALKLLHLHILALLELEALRAIAGRRQRRLVGGPRELTTYLEALDALDLVDHLRIVDPVA